MNCPTLGEPVFDLNLSHTVSDEIRIPERIEIGASGVLFCWALRKTGSIWPGVIGHTLWNASLFLAQAFS